MTYLWIPDIEPDKLADVLGCPLYGDRTPAVDEAWEILLDETRYHLAMQCSVSNLKAAGDPSTVQRQQWELWHVDPDSARESYRDMPVYSLASRRDGLADEFLGKPGTVPGIRASDLERSVALLSALTGEDPMAASAYRPDDRRLALLRIGHSAQDLQHLAANLFHRYELVIGKEPLERLIHRELEGEERERAFYAALAWEHEVEWPLIREQQTLPMVMLRTFDAVIVAAGFIRWIRFWSQQGVDIHTVDTGGLILA